MDTGLNESQESTLVVEKGNHILDYIRRRVSSRLREVISPAPWPWGDAQMSEAILELLLTVALPQLLLLVPGGENTDDDTGVTARAIKELQCYPKALGAPTWEIHGFS